MLYFDGKKYQRTAPRHVCHESYSISLEQLRDVAELVKHDAWPNGKFGDDECAAWEILRELVR